MAFSDRHAESYAAKWRADKNKGEPTSEALEEAFASCVRPARTAEYAAIRKAIRTRGGTTCGHVGDPKGART